MRARRRDDDDSSSVRSESVDLTSYAQIYQEEEEKEALRAGLGAASGPLLNADLCNGGISFGPRGRYIGGDRLNEAEVLTSTVGSFPLVAELLEEETVRVYKAYDFNRLLDNQLPISKYKESILNMIESTRVTIIQGSTGSGKTTQVPQYILDKFASESRHCNIVVTQPRRIAAISIARRVADERGWRLGSLVGYQVGLDRQVSRDTRLTYVTTGVLLQKLVSTKSLSDYTHVILDEIHERDMESDFLMLVVRKLSRTISRDTSIVLMSATVDVDMFADYFSTPVGDSMMRANAVFIKGKTFPVFEFWLDSLMNLGSKIPKLDLCEPCIPPQSLLLARKLVTAFDSFEVIEQNEQSEFATSRGTVLVFLPGIEEINDMYKELMNDKILLKWEIIPLHSSITWDEQKKVFNRPEPGYRKIILSTNIAESSITVPDIKYVIDFCLTKNQVCDSTTNYSWLQLEWASKAQCTQRKGRAGRVSNGRVYRMVTNEFFNHLPEYSTPEMKRCSLHQAVLHSKLLDMGEPKAILGLALDPPDLSDIERTIVMLMEVGALAPRCTERGIISSQDGDLTYVGRIISALPIDVHLGKLVVLGHIFGCLEECIIIAAGLSQKSVFSKPYDAPLGAYKGKMEWADGSFSDCIAILNVYKIWQEHKRSNFFNRPGGTSEKKWGTRSYVQIPRLLEVEKLVKELTARLSGLNIRIISRSQQRDPFDKSLLLKIVIAGAFYPHYFTQGQLDEKEISREVGGFDPHSTVTLSGLPPEHGMIYAQAIKAMLAPCGSQMNIHFDHSKAYVEFLRPTTGDTGQNALKGIRIPPEMFLAIKMRQLRIPLEIRSIPPDEAIRQLRQLNMLPDPELEEKEKENMEGSECGSTKSMKHLRSNRITTLSHSALPKVLRPMLHQTIVEIYVTEIVTASRFWAIYHSPEDRGRMEFMEQLIKENVDKHNQPMMGVLTPGQICLAPYLQVYYRARVESINANNVEVFFVDYGNSLKVKKSELRAINGRAFPDLLSIPMQAMECVLCKLQPSSVTCPSGIWTKEANEFVAKAIAQQTVHGRIYSVVHGVIHLEVIYSKKRNSSNTSLNDELKRLGFAESAEEDLLSEQNYRMRHQMHLELTHEDEDNPRDVQMSIFPDEDKLSKLSRGGRKSKLHGPFSPLEMSFSGLTRAARVRSVRIEPDSVNSVAIDNDHRDEHARLLVASNVTLNASGNSLVARSTTLLPSIHGLLHLIVLMFSPRVEFRTDRERRRYTGALCGLGYQENTGASLFPDHDMEIVFDTQITQDDIIMINKIRIGINVLLNANDDMDNSRTNLIQKKLQEQVLRLVSRPRQSLKSMSFHYPGKWRVVKPEFLLHPELDGTEADILHVLPLLSGIALNEPLEVPQHVEEKPALLREGLLKHVRELHACASTSSQYRLIMCRLCDEMMESPRDVLIHLRTEKHREVEYQLFAGDNKTS